MTLRAAIYARFSSDRQNERSAADQVALCDAWAAGKGLSVVRRYEDAAVSGASTVNRFGLAALLRDARARQFDVVLAEALDRLSRDQADLAKLKKDLAFLDIAIMTVQDGEVGAMHIGLKGLMGELFLADLAQKTRRGQGARVRAGAIGGGRSYGYAPVPGKPGELTIVEAEAAIVRRIFSEFATGRTTREIAASLNAQGIAGPRGGPWNSSTLAGSKARQNGVLQNRLYAGEIVWNRQRFIKAPDTGRRVSRLNPPAEWIRTPAPQLSIVDAETFDAVQQRRAAQSIALAPYARKPRHLLSGLIKCVCCGGNYIIAGGSRLACANYRERGTCSNRRMIGRHEVERRVIAALQTRLADPEVVAEFVKTYREQCEAIATRNRRDRRPLQRRLGEVTRELDKLIDMLIAGTPANERMNERMAALEAERATLKAGLATIDDAAHPVALHPNAPAIFASLAATLQDALTDRGPTEASAARTERLIAAVRGMVEKIEIRPTEKRKPVDITVYGLLASILLASNGPIPSGVAMVAGARSKRYPTFSFAA